MSLTGEGRRGQPSPPPGPQGGAEREKTSQPPPCFLGEGLPLGLGPPPRLPGQGDQHAGEGKWRERPVSLEVPVLQVAVLKGEAFLLSLAPLLVVKVDVGALARGEGGQGVMTRGWESWASQAHSQGHGHAGH